MVTPGVFALVLAGGCLSSDVAETEEGSGETGTTTDEGASGHLDVMTTTEDGETEMGSRPPVDRECTPGDAQQCQYLGPIGTEGVGSCHAARRHCDEAGRWGGCEGAVVPRVEDCRTEADENCDGQAACTGEVEWVRGFGEPNGGKQGWADLYAAEVDQQDRLWFTGSFTESLRVGDTSWINPGARSFLLARLNANGDLEVAHADVRAKTSNFGNALAIDGMGNVALGVLSQSSLQFAAGAPVRERGMSFGFTGVGLFDAKGEYRHDVRMANLDDGFVYPDDIAFDGAGNAWIVGEFSISHAKLGDDPEAVIIENHGGHDAFLVKVTPEGAIAWAHSFGDAADQEFYSIDVDDSGHLWVVGEHKGVLQFKGGALGAPADDSSQFVVKLDGDGGWAWGFSYSGAGSQQFTEVQTDADGGAVVAGAYSAPSVTLGGHHTSKGAAAEAMLVVRYDSMGNVRWAQSWPCFGVCWLTSMAVDTIGQTVISVNVYEDTMLAIAGEQVKTQPEESVSALVKLDRDGDLLWPPRVHDGSGEVAVGPLGSIYIAGSYDGHASFGDDPNLQLDAGVGDTDLYVARLLP